jgi:hypothetical protein
MMISRKSAEARRANAVEPDTAREAVRPHADTLRASASPRETALYPLSSTLSDAPLPRLPKLPAIYYLQPLHYRIVYTVLYRGGETRGRRSNRSRRKNRYHQNRSGKLPDRKRAGQGPATRGQKEEGGIQTTVHCHLPRAVRRGFLARYARACPWARRAAFSSIASAWVSFLVLARTRWDGLAQRRFSSFAWVGRFATPACSPSVAHASLRRRGGRDRRRARRGGALGVGSGQKLPRHISTTIGGRMRIGHSLRPSTYCPLQSPLQWYSVEPDYRSGSTVWSGRTLV